MTTKAKMTSKQAVAKLFWAGRSQAVRLPRGFRIEADRVSIRRMGAGVLLEPISESPNESIEELFARIDAMKGDPILPDGRNQRLAPIRDYFEQAELGSSRRHFMDESKFDHNYVPEHLNSKGEPLTRTMNSGVPSLRDSE